MERGIKDLLKEIFSKSVSQMFDYYRIRAEINHRVLEVCCKL